MTEADLTRLRESAAQNLHCLTKTVLDALKPPPGPYAFFYHASGSLGRLQDCHFILGRLFAGRSRLNALAVHQAATNQMRLDFESLYLFGGILLDQWSLLAISVGRLSLPKKYPFTELVDFLERGQRSVIQPLWMELKATILWLHYQVRFYRNRFVVHANRPWQRSTTHAVLGDDFRLFCPSPPGWLDDERLTNRLRDVVSQHPRFADGVGEGYLTKRRPRALLQVLFDDIGSLESRDAREQVASLFGQFGASTPTFQAVAERLYELVGKGTAVLIEITKANLANVDLGKPERDGGTQS